MGLRNRWYLGLGLGDPVKDSITLLDVREALAIEDLECSVLFYEGHDEDRIVGELALVAGSECGRELRRGHVLSFEAKRKFCEGTNEDDNLSLRLNHIVINDLGMEVSNRACKRFPLC